MPALLTLLLSHVKVVLITIAVAGTATVATVTVNDLATTPEAVELLTVDEDDELLAEFTEATEAAELVTVEEAAELLAEFTEACGTEAVAPDLTGMTEHDAEAAIETLVEQCEEATEAAEAVEDDDEGEDDDQGEDDDEGEDDED